MALGALSAFRDNGIEVPDEVSVIGFDRLGNGVFPAASSTIYQDFAALGEVGVEYLLNMITFGRRHDALRPEADSGAKKEHESLFCIREKHVRKSRFPWSEGYVRNLWVLFRKSE